MGMINDLHQAIALLPGVTEIRLASGSWTSLFLELGRVATHQVVEPGPDEIVFEGVKITNAGKKHG